MEYQLLPWDTDFFSKKTGRIIPTVLEIDRLSSILSEMRKEGYHLAYWPSDEECAYDIDLLGGILVDRKTIFEIDLNNIDMNTLGLPRSKPYTSDIPISQLEKLALQSGEFSRFAVDPGFSRENFSSLYKTWMRKSVTGEMADAILVIVQANQIAGMVTVAKSQGVGSIGLIAVDENFRGKKLGQQLVYDARRWFIKNGCHTAQVVTQGDNLPACNLYEKCGYHRKTTAYFYHFWL
ncbi:MAG: GNAT family N-acetyltransferase [Pelolinea sp.]|nr:GNAT family N-acetyltransferase [Pelolinea sp.]